MDLYRKTAIIVGVLFIIATVTAILTIVFLGSTLDPPDYLTAVSANVNQVIISVIFWLILAVSVMGIGVMMFPILKKHNEGLALGYVWSFEIGTLIFLGLGGLPLYYILYQSKLVPRWLSGWGLIGAALILLYGLLGLFGLTADSMILNILAAPIAVQEMVFAVWLIFKGFIPQEIQSKSS
jgi:hypothetical protein